MNLMRILFFIGMILGALLSFLAKIITERVGKDEDFMLKLKIIGLFITLIFAILLFALS